MFEDGPSAVENPILQCVQIKAMETKDGGQERYRVVLNDITNFIQSMLATRMHSLFACLTLLLMMRRGKSYCDERTAEEGLNHTPKVIQPPDRQRKEVCGRS